MVYGRKKLRGLSHPIVGRLIGGVNSALLDDVGMSMRCNIELPGFVCFLFQSSIQENASHIIVAQD
jgi:hypothetical protein